MTNSSFTSHSFIPSQKIQASHRWQGKNGIMVDYNICLYGQRMGFWLHDRNYTKGRDNDCIIEITNFFYNFLERPDVRVLQLEETFEGIWISAKLLGSVRFEPQHTFCSYFGILHKISVITCRNRSRSPPSTSFSNSPDPTLHSLISWSSVLK
jgi:hypothetical protein